MPDAVGTLRYGEINFDRRQSITLSQRSAKADFGSRRQIGVDDGGHRKRIRADIRRFSARTESVVFDPEQTNAVS